MTRQFSSLIELTKVIPNEDAAIAYFQSIRWKSGAFCPYCGSTKVYHFADRRAHKCGNCRQRFSIKVGTVMEATKIPVRSWLMAIWLVTSHKKGIASTQLARDLGVTQKTAWFMLHRLRYAAQSKSFNRSLKGTVEADEAYLGGKEKWKHKDKRANAKTGTENKALVMGMLERGGELRVSHMPEEWMIRHVVKAHIEPGSTLITDENPHYKIVGRKYQHETVNHAKGQYGRGRHHTNSIEGYWSLLRRQIYGIHHWVSAKYLSQYVAENSWRYNRRDVPDAPRMGEFIARLDGRITYKDLTL